MLPHAAEQGAGNAGGMRDFSLAQIGIAAVLLLAPAQSGVRAPLTTDGLQRLTPDELAKRPVVDVIQAVAPQATSADIRATLQLWLRTLGYFPGLPDGSNGARFHRAVKNFQRANHYPPSGVLTFKQAGTLDRLAVRFAPSDGLIFGRRDVYANAGVIFAAGTWLAVGKKTPSALNYSVIQCSEQTGCQETAFKADGAQNGALYRITTNTRTWTITRWTAQLVEAKATYGPCIDMTLTIDAAAQSARKTTQISAGKIPPCGPPAEYAGTYDLADGQAVSEQLRADRDTSRNEALNPAYRAMIDRLQKAPAWQIMQSLGILTEPLP